ncbi:unnamed protein product [Lupinus luteus]|uniref:Uncharacterized protein n=1 Tax=Lupinus luteus TaxID=3873 RepID=A0AAV1X8B0_LUPLU
MGVVCNWESKVAAAAEAFRQKTMATAAGMQRRKEDEGQKMNNLFGYDDEGDNLVCVTSGVSYLGHALVNQLLLRGYSVRIIVDNQEEIEKVKEIERRRKSNIEVIMVKLSDNNVHNLEKAFQGCHALFHTSSFTDPAGLSGYTLWYALGKMRAERSAWRIANEKGLKLTTICPALITGPQFCHKNPTPTIAYLKGAKEMYSHGLLATIDVTKLAEAHVSVLKEMNMNAYGRYICFDNVIDTQNEAEKLAMEIGMPKEKICGDTSNNSLHRFVMSNEKLYRLMSRPLRCYSEHY